MSLGDVAGPYGGGEAEHRFIAATRDFFNVLETHDVHDGAEDFFFGDLHVVGNVGEDGRLDEIALGADALAAAQHLGAFLLACVDVAHDAVELFL